MAEIYFAGALFSGADNLLNVSITNRLEKRHKVNLPQRDGFEFGRLHDVLSRYLPPEEIMPATQNIIYALDIGYFLPGIDENETIKVTVARCDEPLDPGVDIELATSHFYGNFNIGYRTDVRSPYGSPEDSFGGMHFFPGYMCDAFILSAMPCKTLKSAQDDLERLTTKIEELINQAQDKTSYRWRSPNHRCIAEIEDYANRLFGGIEDLHSSEGMERIAQRYIETRKILKKQILPRFFRT